MPITRLLPAQIIWTGVFSLSILIFATACVGQEPVDLEIKYAHGKQKRFTCDFSHSGRVLIENKDQGKTTSLPLSVDAKMTYFQRKTGDEQSIRYFEEASGKIKVDQGTTSPKLDQSNRLIVARLMSSPGAVVELASLKGILEQPELELIQNPADPMTLPAVFNKTSVKEGDQWQPSNAALAKMLRVYEIEKSSVKLLAKKIDATTARVYLMGSLSALVDDVNTEMDLSGIAIIDRASKTMTSFKLSIRESRIPGQIAPGFEGKTKIDIQVTDASTPHLSSAELAKVTKQGKVRQRVKWHSQVGNFTLNFEPRWKMIAAEDTAAVLRFIERDELLTQCNIVQLPSRPADNPLTMEAYKQEVGKIIAADKNARLVDSASQITETGHTALQVVVAGEEEGLPVTWFYYHVSANDGRQVTLVFTMAESVAKRVSSIASQLVTEFKFQALPKKVADLKNSSTK